MNKILALVCRFGDRHDLGDWCPRMDNHCVEDIRCKRCDYTVSRLAHDFTDWQHSLTEICMDVRTCRSDGLIEIKRRHNLSGTKRIQQRTVYLPFDPLCPGDVSDMEAVRLIYTITETCVFQRCADCTSEFLVSREAYDGCGVRYNRRLAPEERPLVA
jgi:hypothetical protein